MRPAPDQPTGPGDGPQRPEVSVVVTTHDRPAELARAVASVLACDDGTLEVVVVDDASTPPAVVPDDDRVRLVRLATNGGVSVARNRGLAEARGHWVCALDDDDAFTPDRLAMTRPLREAADIVVCWARYEDETATTGRVLRGEVHDTVLDGITPPVSTALVRREAFPRFAEDLGASEDVEWWIEASRAARVATVERVGVVVARPGGPRHRTGHLERARGGVRVLERNRDWFAAHPRAAAFRWFRVGLAARAAGERGLAVRALARSLRLRPSPRVAAHLVRTLAGR
jgi:hypothetical protein